MPTQKSKPHKEELTLRLDGALITPEAFKKAAQAFVDLLLQVTDEVAQGGKKPMWNMSVRPGSSVFVARLVADPETKKRAAKTIKSIRSGIAQISRGHADVPYFNSQALYAARELSSLGAQESTTGAVGITTIELGNGDGKAVPITLRVAEVIKKAISGAHHAYGSIEGRLQTISNRDSFQVVIFDALSDKGVNCFLSEDKFPSAHSAFGKRVRAEGEINYNKDGRPLSIRVSEIKVFKDPKELPPLESFKGFLNTA